jgi:hypothetical protein
MEDNLNYDGTGQKPGGEVRLNLEKSDIHAEIPEPGGTVLVLQVNARDDRSDPKSPDFGALKPEAAEQTRLQAKEFFNQVFDGLNEEERAKVKIIVFASDAPLVMPGGVTSPHMRAFETGEKVIEGAMTSMTEHNIGSGTLLNNAPERGGKPVPVPGLVDLKMWEKPEFVEYLRQLWGDKKLWPNYEGNWEPDMSLVQGINVPPEAETPAEIAVRVRAALTDLTVDFARKYHEENPDGRLIIWADTMYDNISPWLKGYVYQADPARLYAPIEKSGGMVVKISPDGQTATIKIGSQEFQVPSLLRKPLEPQSH